jgi:cell division protein FtsL
MSQVVGSAHTGIRMVPRATAQRSHFRGETIEFILTLALGIVILAAALLYVWQHTYVVRLGYEIERLRARQAALIQENKGLRLEMGQLRSLKRVEDIARRQLGMITPKPDQVILVPESTIQ